MFDLSGFLFVYWGGTGGPTAVRSLEVATPLQIFLILSKGISEGGEKNGSCRDVRFTS